MYRRSTVGAAVDKGTDDYGKKEFWEKRYNTEDSNEISKKSDIGCDGDGEDSTLYEWYVYISIYI
jgi:hypothetical protein